MCHFTRAAPMTVKLHRLEVSWIGWPRRWERWAYADGAESYHRYWCGPCVVTIWKPVIAVDGSGG